MTIREIAPGQGRAWNLLKKLGEGDAGEVFLVESMLDRRLAILKRPSRSAFPSDVVRQATQIEREARILSSLARLNRSTNSSGAPRIQVPDLLDQSEDGTGYTESFFIVITPARGLDLAFLARFAHFGFSESDRPEIESATDITPLDHTFLQGLAQIGVLPDLILLRAINSLIEFLETIHVLETSTPSSRYYGILWNDIKPEHIFYDPLQATFTLIDWGNGLFLGAEGLSEDHQHSRMDDYRQLLEEMGLFLSDLKPDLHAQLAWPQNVSPTIVYSTGILPLKARLSELMQIEQTALHRTRQKETEILASVMPDYDHFNQLTQIHEEIIAYGELPDYQGAERFFHALANELVSNNELTLLGEICQQASKIPSLGREKCHLLGQLAQLAVSQSLPTRILLSGLSDDWPSVLWELRLAYLNQPQPDWWDDICTNLRKLELGTLAIRPLVALNRLIHTLSAAFQERETSGDSSISPQQSGANGEKLLHALKNQILPRWTQIEPDPPESGLEYKELERIREQILEVIPKAGEELINALDQPWAQAKIVMDAWERGEFDTARQGLRLVLLWDPDRSRVLLADRAIQKAPDWLQEVRGGPKNDEPLQDFVTRLELEGRELNNQVGTASWLDAILNAFRGLRKGGDPTNILMEHPEARDHLSWLLELDPRRPLLSSLAEPVHLERLPIEGTQQPTLYGIAEVGLGQKEHIAINNPMDTWVPEARGSSARVFMGSLRGLSNRMHEAAIKIMRPDRVEYALPLFQEEVRILTLLRDVPGISPLLECGFIRLEKDQTLPPEERRATAQDLSGSAIRFGLDSIHNFLEDLENRSLQDWLPYLALEIQPRANNLLLRCDTGYTRGRFLPTIEGLCMAIQILDILEAAHARNIVYRDHKILHYYWQDEYNGIFMIDWNIAKRFPEGLDNTDTQFDLVQFGARTLHYILTGRPAPGALPLGPNRPEEIEAAARSYDVQWTYDDQRLPNEIKEILEAVLAGQYSETKRLRGDLNQIFQRLSELVQKDQESHNE